MSNSVPLGEVLADAGPAKQPEHLAIDGHYTRLEPISTCHISALYQCLCLDSPVETWAYMAAGPFASEEAFAAHIHNIATSKDPLFFTVVPKVNLPGIAAGSPVGYLSLMRIDVKNRGVEIGNVTFSAALQRTTVATEALFLAMRHCLEDLGNRRLEWKCDSLNAKSRRAAQRYGFVFEGMFRKHFIVKGRTRDTAWFSIVDDEWPVIKRALESWLAAGNFDDNGQQIQGLVDIRKELSSKSS
ncbi:putative acetyltransferase, GNAT family [Pestalotiopsis sp. NC0098]|nr:putative acetyltransferase, GNAT family [Pestalotiopsis sp. NC0098]